MLQLYYKSDFTLLRIDGHPLWAYHFCALQNAGLKYKVYVHEGMRFLLKEFQAYTIYEVCVGEPLTNDGDILVVPGITPLWNDEIMNRIKALESVEIFSLRNKLLLSIHHHGKKNTSRYTMNHPLFDFDVAHELENQLLCKALQLDYGNIHPKRRLPEFEISEPVGTGPEMLFSAPYHFFSPCIRSQFECKFRITYAYNADRETTMELLKDKMIWVTGTCPPYFIDVEMIKNAAELKIVATPSTGSTHMDRKGIEKRNIKVCTIRSSEFLANIKASSEHTLALMLAMIRKIPFITAQAKHGIWREQERVNRTIEVAGKTIGIIGYGRIGGNLARYCNSLEMRVIVFDPFKVVKEDYITQVQSKAELLKKCDIVALCYHLDDSTNKSFTGDDFSIMQNGSYFINTARGELVDEDAMLDALKSGKLAAAAVDVITNESLPDKWNHPVIKYARENDNLIITPHTAGLTVDSESKAAMEIYKEIIKVL